MPIRVALLSFSLLVLPVLAGGAEIRTIAGNGKAADAGDGGPATAAGVGQPFGLTIGPDGALYVCEVEHHRIRRIDLKSGIISTVVGAGRKGYAGDGGPALLALCNEPYEIRFDRAGNLYSVERLNHVVRRIDARTGIITTIAGTGQSGYGGDGGPATQARFTQPHSIALDDAGKLYIADIANHRVRQVNLATGIVTTLLGNGERLPTKDGSTFAAATVNGPRALDFESSSQSLILALREGNAVYRLDLRKKLVRHLAGTGKSGYSAESVPAATALLSGPKGVAVAPNGDIYIADTESHTIRVIRRSGLIETVAGNGRRGEGPDGPPRDCQLNRPHGVFVDSAGNVYVGDSSNHRVRLLPAQE
ncbi:MAG: Serine/threonine-protein kinase PknD [Verrucomicrobiota bacterium]|jgi:sugar lactone lactonase YvrE